MNKTPLDDRDFRILTIVADSEEAISSWEVCQKLFPSEKSQVIVSCKFAGNCHPCRLNSQKCRLSEIIDRGSHELMQAFYPQDGGNSGYL